MHKTGMIAVVDDDDAVREATSSLLTRVGHRVRCYESGNHFLDTAEMGELDIVLLDIRMPGLDGIEVLRALKDRSNAPPVVMLSGHGDIPLAVEAVKLGAVEFFEKPYRPTLLLEHIERVLQEGAPTSGQNAAEAQIHALPQRQRDVLKGIVRGNPSKVIAYDLGLSPRTVEAYRAQLLRSLGVRSTAEAIKLAVMAGLGEAGRPAKGR
jgi:two-component system response regulator FixJ